MAYVTFLGHEKTSAPAIETCACAGCACGIVLGNAVQKVIEARPDEVRPGIHEPALPIALVNIVNAVYPIEVIRVSILPTRLPLVAFFGRIEYYGQARRVDLVDGAVVGISVPVVAVADRVLANKPADARVVVTVAHQHQAVVGVRLAAVAAPERRSCASRPQPAEAGGVLVGKLAPAAAVEGPQVAEAVVVVVDTPATLLPKLAKI